MKKKTEIKFGTFTFDGLGLGLAQNEFTDNDLNRANEIINEDFKNIKDDVLDQYRRLDIYIKNNIGAIPRADDFVEWFFDNKKINQTGKNLPKIKDAEIIKYAQIYVSQLDELKKSNEITKFNSDLISYKWIQSEEKLKQLYNNLIAEKFVSTLTDFNTLSKVFSGTSINSIDNNIIWLKKSKNKFTNKKSISDFISILEELKFINPIKDNIPNILSHCFKSTNGVLKFTHSNLSNSNGCSEFRLDLERIIKNL